MQGSMPIPHSLSDLVPYLLAIILAVPGWLVAWKGRKKTDADVDLTDAQAQRELMETKKIEADVTKTYNDIIRDINRDLREALKENEEKTDELEEWKRRALSVPVLEQQITDFQMILSLNEIDFAEAMDKLTRIKNSRAH
jgi:hypothetical protein